MRAAAAADREAFAMAMLDHTKNSDTYTTLTTPERTEPAAQDEADRWVVIVSGSEAVHRTARDRYYDELASAKVRGEIAKHYTELQECQPKGSATYSEVQGQQAANERIAALSGLIALDLARYDGASPDEIKEMRRMLKEQPATLPTVAVIRKARGERLAPSPEDQAAAHAKREARRAANKEDARLAAQARRGTLPTAPQEESTEQGSELATATRFTKVSRGEWRPIY